MDIKALQLEARFSLPPNSLGYCGRDTAAEKFKKCIINGDCDGVEKEVTKFIVLYPYFETIAAITKLPVFSYEVVESYWIGNDLLKRLKPEHYDLLLKNFEKQGVPDFFTEELRKKHPDFFIPNHLFQVLHIGVGKASAAVPFNLKSINNCMIRWGRVIRVQKGKAVIDLFSLEQKKGAYLHTKTLPNPPPLSSRRTPSSVPLSERKQRVSSPDKVEPRGGVTYTLVTKQETVPFNKKLVQEIRRGDIIAVHWNMVVKILNKREEENLLFWTNEVLK